MDGLERRVLSLHSLASNLNKVINILEYEVSSTSGKFAGFFNRIFSEICVISMINFLDNDLILFLFFFRLIDNLCILLLGILLVLGLFWIRFLFVEGIVVYIVLISVLALNIDQNTEESTSR